MVKTIKEIRQLARLARKLGISRLRMGDFEIALSMEAPASGKRVKENLEEMANSLSQGMPSDSDLLLAATPFYQTEAEKKSQAALDDEEESRK